MSDERAAKNGKVAPTLFASALSYRYRLCVERYLPAFSHLIERCSISRLFRSFGSRFLSLESAVRRRRRYQARLAPPERFVYWYFSRSRSSPAVAATAGAYVFQRNERRGQGGIGGWSTTVIVQFTTMAYAGSIYTRQGERLLHTYTVRRKRKRQNRTCSRSSSAAITGTRSW